MDGRDLKYGFLSNHSKLMTRLSTRSLLPYIYSQGLITLTEKDIISHQDAEGLMTDKLLDIIHRQGQSNPSVYSTFFQLLSDESFTSGQNLGDVVRKIQEDAMSGRP